ncbi:hypothetical protein CH063_05010 [Colletotrichum higginsianum]|uniref:Uncharacterized protein n=1 Tax=Colletotrichum higginsianum (strain IMI 349063) TaxID=759273 RepID=H1UXG9_COLHI|nr:hypothetical protein CH063_05010 [Colletotrichum higginsianum]
MTTQRVLCLYLSVSMDGWLHMRWMLGPEESQDPETKTSGGGTRAHVQWSATGGISAGACLSCLLCCLSRVRRRTDG